jgi:large subunit ribosomal protein L31e
MGTQDVRIDPNLNKELWSRGIKSVQHRMRIKLEREYLSKMTNAVFSVSPGKRNDEENAKEKLYTLATHVPVTSFKACVFLTL